MKAESWIQLIVGTVILGPIGFLAYKQYDTSEKLGSIDGKVGSVDTKVTLTSERVERIANALPDMRVHIADEEVRRPIKMAVLSTTPLKTAAGGWQVVVNVLDANSSMKWTFPIELASKDDRKALYMIVGTVHDMEPGNVSVAALEKFAAIAKTNAPVPRYIDANASFILRDTDAEEYLRKIEWLARAAKKSKVGGSIDDWSKLANILAENPDAFRQQQQ